MRFSDGSQLPGQRRGEAEAEAEPSSPGPLTGFASPVWRFKGLCPGAASSSNHDTLLPPFFPPSATLARAAQDRAQPTLAWCCLVGANRPRRALTDSQPASQPCWIFDRKIPFRSGALRFLVRKHSTSIS